MMMKWLYKAIAAFLIVAGFSKITALGEFYRALIMANVFPGWLCAWVCILIPSIEVGCGLLGLFTARTRAQVVSLIGLFGSFAAFNLVRILHGDLHTCSCITTNLLWLNGLFGESTVSALLRSLVFVIALLCILVRTPLPGGQAVPPP